MLVPPTKPPTHKHDYDSLQPPGFQWYAHDPYLSNQSDDSRLAGTLNGSGDTPEEKTWKRYFEAQFAGLRDILREK